MASVINKPSVKGPAEDAKAKRIAHTRKVFILKFSDSLLVKIIELCKN
jgi:hypothetical protein